MGANSVSFGLGVLCLLVMAISGLPDDFSGVFMAMMLFILPLIFRSLRKKRIVFFLLLAFCFMQVGTLINIFFFHIPGAYEDARRFHENASGIRTDEVEWGIRGGTGLVMWALWFLYSVVQPSMLLGQQTSILAFFLSTMLFFRLRSKLLPGVRDEALFIIFAFLPTMVLWGAAILREPWQALMVFWATLLSLNNRSFWWKSLALCVPLLLLSFLQGALLAFSLGFFALMVLFHFRVDCFVSRSKLRLLIVSLLLIGLGLIVIPTLVRVVTVYRTGAYLDAVAAKGRSLYGGIIHQDSLPMAVIKLPIVFFGYMFFPLPFQVRRAVDIYAMFEAILRFFLMFFGYKAWRKSKGEQRRKLTFVWLTFLGMEALWAVGTVSWFTGMRHHMPAFGLLVLLGGPGLIAAILKKWKAFRQGILRSRERTPTR